MRRLELSAEFESGIVEGVAEDQDIQVGDQKIKLSACKRHAAAAQAGRLLGGRQKAQGALAGLDKVMVAVGGQTLTVNLSRATSLLVRAPKPVAGVDCVLVARQGDKEVGRYQTRLRVEGVTLVKPADPTGVAIRPPDVEGDKVVKTLPAIASDIAVGGGGRYLVVYLQKLKKLAIFDVNEAKIARYIPLSEDKVVYAAGLDKLVIGLTEKGILERWNLKTGEKELTRPTPGGADVTKVLMGSASRGPVLVNNSFLDLDTLKPLPIKLPESSLPALEPSFGGRHSHRQLEGTAQSTIESATFVLEGDELKRDNEGGSSAISSPGPDGRSVYTRSRGLAPTELKECRGRRTNPAYCLPAVEGDFFLS